MESRANFLMLEHRLNDNSFNERGFLGLPIKYRQDEVKDIWFRGIELGIEIGLQKAGLEGQIIEINNNMQNKRHEEFYTKFSTLAAKYECSIQYHPEEGMCVVDNKR